MDGIDEKLERLRAAVAAQGSLLVAYSGGVDSALVLAAAVEVLGERALAVTADSPSVPRRELDGARRTAAKLGARHVVVPTAELDDPRYAANPGNRCYFCKRELYARLAEIARREGIRRLANGTNLDDLGDHRPGLAAADELQVVSPLRDAGMTKSDVRDAARRLGLPVWDKPASPCLASRIPYGTPVTPARLSAVEAAEERVRAMGPRELRVRHFGDVARVELPAGELEGMRARLAALAASLGDLGFRRVELVELRSGALNDVLDDALDRSGAPSAG
jgi:uncharacterized protein